MKLNRFFAAQPKGCLQHDCGSYKITWDFVEFLFSHRVGAVLWFRFCIGQAILCIGSGNNVLPIGFLGYPA